MANIWNLLLYHPLLNSLIYLTKLTGSLGWAVIILTSGLRLIMTPLTTPSLKASKKMQDLAPELAELKKKFKDDKQGMITAQSELYKKHGLNPAAGCLPQIVQILVLIALFNAFNTVLRPNGENIITRLNKVLYSSNQLAPDAQINTSFLGLDLAKPDVIHVNGLPFPLPGLALLLTGLVQLVSSVMMLPEVKAQEKQAEKTEEGMDDALAASQKQMVYMFPIMTIFFGFQFPAGLVMYWLIFSGISVVQQYFAVGWGGLTPWLAKLNLVK